MSIYIKCPTCGEFGWDNWHKCKPIYEAAGEDDASEDEWSQVNANSHSEAAERHAENEFLYSEPFTCMTVLVRLPGSEEVRKFDVHVEAVPEFTATPVY